MKSPKLATLVGSEYNKEDIPHTTELPINFLLNDRKIMEKKLKYPGNNMFMSLVFYQIFIQGHILDIFETDYLVVLSTLMNPYMITRLDDLK